MKLFAVVLGVALVGLNLGCKGRSVVGNWVVDDLGTPVNVVFYNGGSLQAVFELPKGTMTYTGSWSHEKDKLALGFATVDTSGYRAEELEKLVLYSHLAGLGYRIGTIKWNDDGSFDWTFSQYTSRFHPRR